MKNIKERPTYLCGGVVFFLLTYSSYPNPTTKELLTGASGDHSDFQIMVDLLNAVFNKELELPIESLHTQISRYKACKTLKCSVLPFDSSPLCNAYKDISDEDYQKIVEKMDYLVSTHIDIDMKEKFVKLLLHIIKNDTEIDNSELFYVTEDRKPTTKTELLRMTEFTLSYFLVGILHYVFTYRTVTDNPKQADEIKRKGKETLDILASKNGSRSPRDINDLIAIYEAYTIKVIARDSQYILQEFLDRKNRCSSGGILDESSDTLKTFKKHATTIITLLMNPDFESPQYISKLKNAYQELYRHNWEPETLFFTDKEIKNLISDTNKTIQELSPRVLQINRIMKGIPTEDTDLSLKILQPELQELRSQLEKQYLEICEKIKFYDN